jgi:hypothetical protein
VSIRVKVPIYLEAVADLAAEWGLHVGDDRGGGDAQAPRRLHQLLCQSARLKHGSEVRRGGRKRRLGESTKEILTVQSV